MIALDMRRIACAPVYDAHSALVYTGSGAAVTHAWVEGRALLEQRRLCTLEHEQLLGEALAWHDRISRA